MDQFKDDIQAIFHEYRESMRDFEPGPEFMPKLWSRIDARRGFTLRIKRFTHVFLAGAAALCLVMTGVLVLPISRQPVQSTYVDILAEAHPSESLAALGIVRDPADLNRK